MQKDTVLHTFFVAILVCLVCSLMVSLPAVLLKPQQVANADYNKQVNILLSAGLLERDQVKNKNLVKQLFTRVESKVIDLRKGTITDIDPHSFSIKKTLSSNQHSKALEASQDIAGIKRLENLVKIYTTKKLGGVDKVIFPIRGYGLWSTLHGYIALEKDLNTVKGLIFYQHAETPGLGGEVDNLDWQDTWESKKLFDNNGKVQLQLVKGSIDASATTDMQAYQVDGLAGATLTSRGINNLLLFWFGEQGFKKFLNNYKRQI